jgi:AcrR family transcriptional regulator
MSIDAVVDAALSITRRSGLAALTVRSVAEELGVTGPALYYHVPGGKPALISLVIDRVTALHLATPEPEPGETWIDHVERLVSVVCQAEADFPGVMHLIMSAGDDHLVYVTTAHTVFDVLVEEGGFAPDTAARVLDALIAMIVGWIDHQMPTPGSARELGFDRLADATAATASDDPELQLRRWIRALLIGFDHLRHENAGVRT